MVCTLVVVLLGVGSRPTSAGPPPSTGELIVRPGAAGCIAFAGTDGDGAVCAVGRAFAGMRSAQVSPDGRHVYGASRQAAVTLDRDPATGELTQKAGTAGCTSEDGLDIPTSQGGGGTPGACLDGKALDEASQVEISPDGSSVYVASANGSKAIAVFDRNEATGEITQKAGTAGCLSTTGNGGICATGRQIAPLVPAISPDGKNMYVAGGAGVVTLDRDLTTGELTQKAGAAGCVRQTAADGCAIAFGLFSTTSVAVAPDGKNVYAATGIGLVVFDRDLTTGELTRKPGTAGCLSPGGAGGECADARSLLTGTAIAVSPDGADVYMTADQGSSLNAFDRDLTTGELTQKAGSAGCLQEVDSGVSCGPAVGIDDPVRLAVSADGGNIYLITTFGSSLLTFDRDPATGAPTQKAQPFGCFSHFPPVGCNDGQALIAGYDLAIPPDDKQVYTSARTSGAIGIYDRAVPTCDATVVDEAQLRAALACADTATVGTTITVGADITIDDGTHPTYSGSTPLAIDGAGHVLDADGASRVLESTADAQVTFQDVTITGGSTSGDGGGVHAAGPLVLQDATVWKNAAGGAGGGIQSSGDMVVVNSTITQNSADGEGGGVAGDATIAMDHSTIASNSSTTGANLVADTLRERSRSVVADPHDGANCAITSSTPSDGHNLSDDLSCDFTDGTDDQSVANDARLGPARNNGLAPAPIEAGAVGSPRPTMFPLNGSPLIDAIEPGDCAAAPPMDQRGVARPFGDSCDIGAVEAVFGPHDRNDVTPFYEPTVRWITSLVNTPQILNGFNDGTFGQKLNITRGQVVRMYYRAAGQPDVSELPDHGFGDVTAFFEDAVTWAKANGVFDGFADGTFRQANPINRGNYTRSLYGFAGAPDPDGPPPLDPHGFGDVTAFYEDAVRWAKANGLADGFADNTFRQTDNINRGNASRIMYGLARTPNAWDNTELAPDNMIFQPNLPA